jgi:hypothetical protein
MAEESSEVWVVRDTESSIPSRAVSLRKLRRGVEIGKLQLDYEVARVGTDRWTTLAELFESRKSPTVVLTESSVVTSAPSRVSPEDAARVLERATRPRLRRIEREAVVAESEPFSLVPPDVVSERDLLSDPDLSEPDGADIELLPASDRDPDFSPPSGVVLPETTDEPEPTAAPLEAAGPTNEVAVTFAPEPSPNTGPLRVVVTDVHMPFGSMVLFMVKWSLASIPALFILAMVGSALAAIGVTLLTAFGALSR